MIADRTLRWLLGIVAIIALFGVLYFAASIFAPIACALFIIAIAWPMQNRLQRILPQLAALAIVTSVIVVVFLVFGSVVGWGFGRIGRSLVADAPRFQMLYDQMASWLEGHGIYITGLWAEHFNVRWLAQAAQGVAGRLNNMVSFWIVVLVYVLLGLLEIKPMALRIRSALSKQAADVLIEGSRLTATKFHRYMMIRTVMSVATGAVVFALAKIFGLQFAAEWGIIAFTMNYIPFIGPFVATMLPTFYALAQFESFQSALLVFACLNVTQFAIGSYIEPRVAGKALAISPFIVLFSVFLWTFIWGLFGAFIGVPITIAVFTFCAQSPSAEWLARLFGASNEDAG